MSKSKIIRQFVHKLSKTKISAIEYNPRDKSLELIQKEIPPENEEQTVLVKTAFAGINSTDLAIIDGNYPLTHCPQPRILGQEITGIVCESLDEKFQPGDRVVVNPVKTCRVCDKCREKTPHYCHETKLLGVDNSEGGWQEYTRMNGSQLHLIPKEISLSDAILAYHMSCVAHAVHKLKPIAHGSRILLLGADILFVAYLHLNGHKLVTVCDENIKKLNNLVHLQTNYDLITPDLHKRQVKSCFDVIINCSGESISLDLLKNGGRLLIFNPLKPETEIKLNIYQVFRKELEIFSARLNPFTFPQALNLIQTMHPRYLSKLGVRFYNLCEFKQAISCQKQGMISKGVFSFIPEHTS